MAEEGPLAAVRVHAVRVDPTRVSFALDSATKNRGTGPAWTTAFAVHILVNTERGDCYKTADAIQWMGEAGFPTVTELEPSAVVQGIKARET